MSNKKKLMNITREILHATAILALGFIAGLIYAPRAIPAPPDIPEECKVLYNYGVLLEKKNDILEKQILNLKEEKENEDE